MPESARKRVQGVGDTKHRDSPISRPPRVRLTKTLRHSTMAKIRRRKSESRDIFERLESHGIGTDEFGEILQIIVLDLPQSTLFFEQQFRDSAPQQVLRQTERWRQLLATDFILPESQRKDIEKSISLAEMLAWNVLWDMSFPRLGPWNLFWTPLPTSFRGRQPVFIFPSIEVVAIHQSTKEQRTAVIPGKKADGTSSVPAWRTGFERLGLLELVLKQPSRKRSVSREQGRPWPIYTQIVIPRLYEYMRPYYRSRGHVWSGQEKDLTRDAYYPNDLLEDMLAVLQQQHPLAFARKTAGQLKSMIQRHRERRSTPNRKSR